MERAKELLVKDDARVLDVAIACGLPFTRTLSSESFSLFVLKSFASAVSFMTSALV